MVLAYFTKFKRGLCESSGIECFEGTVLEPCLFQPCFHVAGCCGISPLENKIPIESNPQAGRTSLRKTAVHLLALAEHLAIMFCVMSFFGTPGMSFGEKGVAQNINTFQKTVHNTETVHKAIFNVPKTVHKTAEHVVCWS